MTPLFQTLAEYLTLDQAQARRWWQALTKARWQTAQRWRRELCYFDAQPGGSAKLDALTGLLETVAAPARLIEVLEALASERLLRRKDASVIEQQVLNRMNREGAWY